MSANLQAVPITAAEDAEWDQLVAASRHANTFVRAACLQLIEQTDSYGVRFNRVGVRDKHGRLVAGWALPYRERLGFRYSTYFEFFYAGPFLHPDLDTGSVHVARERMETAQALARCQADALDIIEAETHPALADIRPFLYAGWRAEPLYTHVWDMADSEAVWQSMNREKRRVIRRAAEKLTFRFEPPAEIADEFVALYRNLILKFNWVPLPWWDRDLRERMHRLFERDWARLYAARAADGSLQAAVLALLSPDDRTAYLWRCAYIPNEESMTVVPSLYWHAATALTREWLNPCAINFGGSPRMSLTLFKDYIGAKPVLHFRLIYRRASWRTHVWRGARHLKERARYWATRSGALSALYQFRNRGPDRRKERGHA